MSTPIGTDIAAVTAAWSSVPWMAWTAPPPTRREVMPDWLLVHHCASRSIWPPLATVDPRIHTSGITATANAVHMRTRARRSLAARPPDFSPKSLGVRDPDAGGAVGWSSSMVLIR